VTEKKSRPSKNPVAPSGPHFLELREIKRLIAMLNQTGASEIELEHMGARLRIRMPEPKVKTEFVQVPSPFPVGSYVAGVPSQGGSEEAGSEGEEKTAKGGEGLEGALEIKSPMVGTFYRAPSPDADPFVQVGDRVDAETTVCIIEAMKVMNEIKAETEGEIVKVLAENGEPIEFGQPLFLVKPI